MKSNKIYQTNIYIDNKNQLKRKEKNIKKQNIPYYNFFEDHDIRSEWGIQQGLSTLLFFLRDGYYLQWEAVECLENNIPLNEKQNSILERLINFSGNTNDRILYIDEMPRPIEPWYITVSKFLPELILDPFETYVIYDEFYFGFPELINVIEKQTFHLSLPEKADNVLDVIPKNIFHRLLLQNSFDSLYGLGQESELTLEDAEQREWRLDEFLISIKKIKETLKFLDINIFKLLKILKLPQKDEIILINYLLNTLKLKDINKKIYQSL